MSNSNGVIRKVVVIGGTGHFGQRICKRLAKDPQLRLIVTSRDQGRAEALAENLRRHHDGSNVSGSALDQQSSDFETILESLDPFVVIHTAGPYQEQDYRVAEVCIGIRSHYIDMADGRGFVGGFRKLDAAARRAGVLLITGASTLPGISSAVINEYRNQFRRIRSIEVSIAPGHQTPRGRGTISAVLSYCGQPFQALRAGAWDTLHGWQHLRIQNYPELGRRLSAACDVPDLELFPEFVPGVETVSFHAALEAPWEQLALWLMAWTRRSGIVPDWTRYTDRFAALSKTFSRMGTDRGGMLVRIAGDSAGDAQPEVINWFMSAYDNHGPEIPCAPSIIVAKKLLSDELQQRGATPCLGLFSVDDLLNELSEYTIAVQEF